MKRLALTVVLLVAFFTGQPLLSATADAPPADFTSWGTPIIESQNPYAGDLSMGVPLYSDMGNGWPEGTVFQVEWLRDGVAIPDTGLYMYTPTEADRGHHLAFRVTGSLDGYNNKTATSERTTQIVSPLVTVTGQFLVGKTLTATAPSFPGITYKYQWWTNFGNTLITTSTKATYKIPDSLAGENIYASAQSFENGIQVSAGVLSQDSFQYITGGKHIASNFKVSIGGSAMVDNYMTANATNPDGRGTCTEQWLRDGKTVLPTIDGAMMYYPVAADVGHKITFKMTCSFYGRTGSTTKSAVSRKIVKAPMFDGTPSVTGSVVVGNTVAVQVQEIYGQHWTPGTTFTYQWLKDGKKISGATAETYLIPAGFAAHKISVTVTGHKPGYTTDSMTSSKVLVTQ